MLKTKKMVIYARKATRVLVAGRTIRFRARLARITRVKAQIPRAFLVHRDLLATRLALSNPSFSVLKATFVQTERKVQHQTLVEVVRRVQETSQHGSNVRMGRVLQDTSVRKVPESQHFASLESTRLSHRWQHVWSALRHSIATVLKRQ